MKSTFATTALSLTLSIPACFIMSDAFAGAYLYGSSKTKDFFGDVVPVSYFLLAKQSAFNVFNKDFSEENTQIGYLGADTGEKVTVDGVKESLHYSLLEGKKKRFGVFRVQKKANGKVEDLVLESEDKAINFCSKLKETADSQTSRKSDFVYIYDYDGAIDRIIAVGYQIAYGAGSVAGVGTDGKSTPARKHVFCPHSWNKDKWKLEPGEPDENVNTGIRTVSLNANGYSLTCMDGKSTTFKGFAIDGHTEWQDENSETEPVSITNGATEHMLNEKIGANYCHMK